MPEVAPQHGMMLGFDFGEKRIGVALGNTITGTASALEVIDTPSKDVRFSRIAELIQQWEPVLLVIGSPSPGNPDHPVALRCQRFANQLHGRFGLPIRLVDESYSSAEAQSQLDDLAFGAASAGQSARARSSTRTGTGPGLDAVAAAIILQQVLDEFC